MKKTFIQLAEECIEEQNLLVGCEITAGTFRNYHIRLNVFREFLKEENKEDITPEEIKLQFINKYCNWIKYSKKYQSDFVMKCVQLLSRVFKYGIENEIIEVNPCDQFKYKYNRDMKRNYISLKELEKIDRYIPQKIGLETTKDLFLFSAYTGLAFSDLMNFRYNDHVFITDNVEWILLKRKKTHKDTLLPLLPKAKEILIKYENVLPHLSNYGYNYSLKLLSRVLKLSVPLTTHSARKTFGMIMHNEFGVSIDTVSKMLGHAKIRTTQQWYVKTDERKILADMGSVIAIMSQPP